MPTTPPTFVADDPLAADELNLLGTAISELQAATAGIGWSAVHVKRTTNQSIPDTTHTAVSFGTEAHDTGGWWSSGTNVVVPAGAIPAGYTTIAVHAICIAKFATNTTGARRVALYVNGSEEDFNQGPGLSGDNSVVILPTYAVVEAADVLTMDVYQSSGGALNLISASFWVVRHSPVA